MGGLVDPLRDSPIRPSWSVQFPALHPLNGLGSGLAVRPIVCATSARFVHFLDVARRTGKKRRLSDPTIPVRYFLPFIPPPSMPQSAGTRLPSSVL
jgi:hypothetical protein